VHPIVAGNVFLRLVGSLGLQLNRGACDEYGVRGKQYGVGTKDGCTLMAASIEAFMESHPGSIDITGDISSAFCDVADALDEVSQPRGVHRADLR
jgi:hypothetical protein